MGLSSLRVSLSSPKTLSRPPLSLSLSLAKIGVVLENRNESHLFEEEVSLRAHLAQAEVCECVSVRE